MSDYILNLLPLKDEEHLEFEQTAPDAVHVYAGRRTVTPEQLEQATVIMGWPRPSDLSHCKNLKWFQCMFAGVDGYDTPGLLPKGAMLTSSSGFNSLAVAEHILACLLSLCKKLPQCRDNQQKHIWLDLGKTKTITGATVLVVGAGNIGSAVAQRCQALGAFTIGLKRTINGPISGFDKVCPSDMLDELLPEADVVILTLPHSDSTKQLMDTKRLNAMKQDAILINAGRGSVLDQDALIEVLKSGKLWGAALDVTQPEPLPADHPLWDAPNLIITPHLAGGIRFEITRRTCVTMALENLKRYLAKEPLENLVKVQEI